MPGRVASSVQYSNCENRGFLGRDGAVFKVMAMLCVRLVVRWFGTNTDVTEEREAADEREHLLQREREARERATTILESITDAFLALDREWRFTYVNRRAESLLRRTREELVGKSLWDEFSEAVGTTADHELHRALRSRSLSSSSSSIGR